MDRGCALYGVHLLDELPHLHLAVDIIERINMKRVVENKKNRTFKMSDSEWKRVRECAKEKGYCISLYIREVLDKACRETKEG